MFFLVISKSWKVIKNGPHLSCNLHKIGANLYSKFEVAPYCAKKYGLGWMGGWVGGRTGLRIAYSNQNIYKTINNFWHPNFKSVIAPNCTIRK